MWRRSAVGRRDSVSTAGPASITWRSLAIPREQNLVGIAAPRAASHGAASVDEVHIRIVVDVVEAAAQAAVAEALQLEELNGVELARADLEKFDRVEQEPPDELRRRRL